MANVLAPSEMDIQLIQVKMTFYVCCLVVFFSFVEYIYNKTILCQKCFKRQKKNNPDYFFVYPQASFLHLIVTVHVNLFI